MPNYPGIPGLPQNLSAIKTALFALGQAATFTTPINGKSTWGYTSRRLKLWNAVDQSIQPAMFLVQHREMYEQYGVGRLTRRFLEMGFWCYAPSGDPASAAIIGDDLLDIMISALERQLQPDDPGRNELTLGGLLTPNNGWARIDRRDGLFIRDPGDIDGQVLLVLPVRILLP